MPGENEPWPCKSIHSCTAILDDRPASSSPTLRWPILFVYHFRYTLRRKYKLRLITTIHRLIHLQLCFFFLFPPLALVFLKEECNNDRRTHMQAVNKNRRDKREESGDGGEKRASFFPLLSLSLSLSLSDIKNNTNNITNTNTSLYPLYIYRKRERKRKIVLSFTIWAPPPHKKIVYNPIRNAAMNWNPTWCLVLWFQLLSRFSSSSPWKRSSITCILIPSTF